MERLRLQMRRRWCPPACWHTACPRLRWVWFERGTRDLMRTGVFMTGEYSIRILFKSRIALAVGLGVFLLTASVVVASRRAHESATAAATASASHRPLPIAGPGRIEPYSEDIKIGSELSGRLKSLNVEEGDAIRHGQVFAELENADYRAQVESARANLSAIIRILELGQHLPVADCVSFFNVQPPEPSAQFRPNLDVLGVGLYAPWSSNRKKPMARRGRSRSRRRLMCAPRRYHHG